MMNDEAKATKEAVDAFKHRGVAFYVEATRHVKEHFGIAGLPDTKREKNVAVGSLGHEGDKQKERIDPLGDDPPLIKNIALFEVETAVEPEADDNFAPETNVTYGEPGDPRCHVFKTVVRKPAERRGVDIKLAAEASFRLIQQVSQTLVTSLGYAGGILEFFIIFNIECIKVVGHVQPHRFLAFDAAVRIFHRQEGDVGAMMLVFACEDSVKHATRPNVAVKMALLVVSKYG